MIDMVRRCKHMKIYYDSELKNAYLAQNYD